MSDKSVIKYPVAIQWKIDETRLQAKKNSIDGFLKSPIFDVPETDVRYFLKICPNGDTNEKRGQTWIYFRLEMEEERDIEAGYTLSIKSSNFSKTATSLFKKSQGWGYHLCDTAELYDPAKRFIVDGKMTMILDGFLMIEKEVPPKIFELGSDADSLCLNLWNQENKDFTIVADGKEIHTHKLILSTRSPVFSAMFQPHTQEAQDNKVTISDFTFDVVEAAIKLCYHSSLVGNISLEDQLSLLQFFDKYDMQSLKDKLETFLLSIVDESNVCRLTNCSIISNAPNLRDKCFDILRDCLKTTKAVCDFDILDKEFAMDLLQNSFRKLGN